MEHFKSLFAEMYLRVKDPKSGLTITKGTSDLDVEQCSKYIDKVKLDYLEQGGDLSVKDEMLYKETKC